MRFERPGTVDASTSDTDDSCSCGGRIVAVCELVILSDLYGEILFIKQSDRGN